MVTRENLCIRCRLASEDGLECDDCQGSWCLDCLNKDEGCQSINAELYKKLTEIGTFVWSCPNCSHDGIWQQLLQNGTMSKEELEALGCRHVENVRRDEGGTEPGRGDVNASSTIDITSGQQGEAINSASEPPNFEACMIKMVETLAASQQTMQNQLYQLVAAQQQALQATQLQVTQLAQMQTAAMQSANNDTKPAMKNDDYQHDSTVCGQLPRVDLPKFDGKKTEWRHFWESFETNIDRRKQLSPKQKLDYLHRLLHGAAYDKIKGLGLEGASYPEAVAVLKKKYDDPHVQRRAQWERLQQLPKVLESLANLEKFTDEFRASTLILSRQGVSGEVLDSFLPQIMKKLPLSLIEEIEKMKVLQGSQEEWEVDEFLRALENQMLLKERVASSKNFEKVPTREKVHTHYGNDASEKPREKPECVFCQGKHWNDECPTVGNVDERREIVAKESRCFKCLSKGHRAKDCKRRKPCFHCKASGHHSALCTKSKNGETKTEPQKLQSDGKETLASQERTMTSFEKDGHEIGNMTFALRTVPIVLQNGNRKVRVNALLDDGSTQSYVNVSVASELGLKSEEKEIRVNVLNGGVTTMKTMPVEMLLHSANGEVTKNFTAMTAENVTGNLQAENWGRHQRNWSHLNGIKFPQIGKRASVDVLIGIDNAELHSSYKEIHGEPGSPIARLTPLGWTCVGPVGNDFEKQTVHMAFHAITCTHDMELNGLVKRFWEDDDAGKCLTQGSPLSAEENDAMSVVKKTCLETPEGRYEVGVPWRLERPEKNNGSYAMAMKRLASTERRLSKNPEVAKEYNKIIERHVEKGYVSVVPHEQQDGWFLPHFPIVRPTATTTKVRIVFDASAKAEGRCLNDYIYPGPKLQRELPTVLLRFRKKPIALVADVTEMYLQIQLPEEDRDYHKFLWRNLDSTSEPTVYQYNRVVFGLNASPFLAQYVTQEHARRNKETHPMAAAAVLNSTYMDDTMDSTDDTKQAITLYQQLDDLWTLAGMHARKWASNSHDVLAHVPEEDRAKHIDLSKGQLASQKVLGILWDCEEDKFTFQARSSEVLLKPMVTKRLFLKNLATIFDPLGFILPVTITGRIIFQDMWVSGAEWDGGLPLKVTERVEHWYNQLEELNSIAISRCLMEKGEHVVSTQLHIFSDASLEAYGACAYLRHTYASGRVSCLLVMARGKVAPLHAVSIPRLELMAAVLGLRLATATASSLEIHLSKVTFWSDSLNVLFWLKCRSRSLRPFVANRVAEIQVATTSNQWRYVPTKLNPADLASRGCTVSDLKENQQWWNGPQFLQGEEDQWPARRTESLEDVNDEVKKGATVLFATTAREVSTDPSFRLHPERFSKWDRLLRVTAWVFRFIDTCRGISVNREADELTIEEMEDAETYLIHQAQSTAFRGEIAAITKGVPLPATSKIRAMNPTIDEDGIMRCGGRLQHADYLPAKARHPVILPRRHAVTQLIVRFYHERNNHAVGTSHLLALLSEKYWIVAAREEIREGERRCNHCKRIKAKPIPQAMAPLHPARVRMSMHAFDHASVDYGGPFNTIQGRGRRRAKRYLCLFTCLSTRAVHLEIALGLDTNSFMNAFMRMANRRGFPHDMTSDNGTNFVGAAREIKELVENLDKTTIQQKTMSYGVKWHFNPAAAPHFGGAHEVMIRAAKRAVYAILGNADVTDEELMTAFCGAEALINSRPLTYQSAHPLDDPPLTPNNFLHGQVGGMFAPELIDDQPFSLHKRWRRVQDLLKHFWRRWMREVLPSLSGQRKWFAEQQNLEVGEVVLVVDPDCPRGRWPLGRIIKVHPGSDGKVRVVAVQVNKKVLTRPTCKICPLRSDE